MGLNKKYKSQLHIFFRQGLSQTTGAWALLLPILWIMKVFSCSSNSPCSLEATSAFQGLCQVDRKLMKFKWRAAPSSSHLILSFDSVKPWQRTPDLITGACTWWSNYCQVSGCLLLLWWEHLKVWSFQGLSSGISFGKGRNKTLDFLQIWAVFSQSVNPDSRCLFLLLPPGLHPSAKPGLNESVNVSVIWRDCSQHIHPASFLKGRLQTDNTQTLFQQPSPAQVCTSLQGAVAKN